MKDDSKSIKTQLSIKQKKEIDLTIHKISGIIRHIKNVQENCLLLGTRLIEHGHINLGKTLIANGLSHDISKFYGIEWDNLSIIESEIDQDPSKLKRNLSVNHHRVTNSHHPEYWGGITQMPTIAIAEMVCDWKSRSEEFGNSLRDWIDDTATKTWKFDKTDLVFKDIYFYVNLLCEKPFEQIK